MTTGEFRHLTGVPITLLFHWSFLKQPAVPLFITVFAIKAHIKWWTQWTYVNNKLITSHTPLVITITSHCRLHLPLFYSLV